MFELKTIDTIFNASIVSRTNKSETALLNATFIINNKVRSLLLTGYFKFNALNTLSLISINHSISNTCLTHVRNEVKGSRGGFFIELILKGIGFKVFRFANYMFLQLGFSHFYVYRFPSDLIVKAKRDRLVIFGEDKCKVGNAAREIYSLRIPDAYKAKGIQYKDCTYKLKEGKKK